MPDLTRISELEAWLDFSGRLHPLLVHFPIALLIVAFLLEVVFGRSRRPGSVQSVLVVQTFGALGAAVAAGAGWMLALQHNASGARAEALELHRWAGVVTAAVALLALLVGLAVRKRQGGGGVALFRWLLFLGAGGVGAAGHLGAGLVWGDSYLFDPFAGDGKESAPEVPVVTEDISVDDPSESGDLEAAVGAALGSNASLIAGVEAVFAESCLQCHGPTRARAGLRLDDLHSLTDDEDPSLGVVVPDDLDESWLWTVITLPEEDPDHMPKDEPSLDAASLAAVKAWILAGAPSE